MEIGAYPIPQIDGFADVDNRAGIIKILINPRLGRQAFENGFEVGSGQHKANYTESGFGITWMLIDFDRMPFRANYREMTPFLSKSCRLSDRYTRPSRAWPAIINASS